MTTGVQGLKERLFSSPTYLDVLALAMAKTKNTRFSADPGRWNCLIAQLQEQLEPDAPELLGNVYFDFRSPGRPYSEEVESFFRVMGGAEALSLGNPAYQVYIVDGRARQDILRTQGPALQGFEKYIDLIADAIDANMALPSQ